MLKKCHIKNMMMSNKFLYLLIILFIVVLFIKLSPKNYKIEYKYKDYKITEQYLKKDKMYIFKITDDTKKYETISTKRYTTKRKVITKITNYEKNDTSCIVIKSDRLDNNILCLKNNKKIDYNLTKLLPKKYYTKYKKNEKEYENININFIDDKTYLVWNYTGYYKLNKNKIEKIKLFKNDVYNPHLSIIMDKYIIIADYDEQYNFNKLLKINIENKKIEKIKLDDDISFDSKILGYYKNDLYILDEKNKKEYEIDIKRENTSIVNRNGMGKILENDKWVKYKINKIITDKIEFKENRYNEYKIDNGIYLYQKKLKKPTMISKKDIKIIVYQGEDEVYYISGNSLYKYDFVHGENKVLDYFELNFNHENIIMVY